MTGKDKCDTLREIRKSIAVANDIQFESQDCTHEGECSGTCPKCEEELGALEGEILARQMAGESTMLSGVAAGMVAQPASDDDRQEEHSFFDDLPFDDSPDFEDLAGIPLPEGQPPSVGIHLTIENSETNTVRRQAFDIREHGELILGSSPECDIVVDDACISSRQFRFYVKKNRFFSKDDVVLWIQNLGRGNSAYVNGSPFKRKMQLNDSVEIRVGPITFTIIEVMVI